MSSAVLSSRRDVGGGLLLVALEVDVDAAGAYTTPGQYVEVKAERGNGYFVLAGDPGARTWELLVRNAGDAAAALTTLPLGSAVDVSAPHGRGFPIEGAHGRPLVVAVVGSAMAVARPVLRRRIAVGDAASTYIFVGVRAPADVPLASEVEEWAEHGARVVLCVSRASSLADPAGLEQTARVEGYVQQGVARALASGEIPAGALVVAAGPEDMLAEMRGLPAEYASAALEVVTNV